jgi:hypothetical protein
VGLRSSEPGADMEMLGIAMCQAFQARKRHSDQSSVSMYCSLGPPHKIVVTPEPTTLGLPKHVACLPTAGSLCFTFLATATSSFPHVATIKLMKLLMS